MLQLLNSKNLVSQRMSQNKYPIHIKPNFLRILSILICWTGVLYQSWKTSDGYFSYPVKSMISNDDELWNLPAIGICPATDRGPMADVLVNMSMSERADFIPEAFEYFEYCIITLPNNKVHDCSSVTKFRVFFGPIGKCFILFETRDLLIPRDLLKYDPQVKLSTDVFATKIKSPFSAPRSWMVRIYHPEDNFLFGRKDTAKLWFEMPINRELSIEHSYTHRLKLEEPYPYPCYNYRQTNLTTRNKAVDDCIIRRLSKLTGEGTEYKKSWPYVSFFEPNLTYIKEYYNAYEQSGNVTSKLVPEVNRLCSKLYKKGDCNRVSYDISQELSNRPPIPNSTEVVIRIPGLPISRLKTELAPLFELPDYINGIGGILNFWLNFAVYSSLLDSLPGKLKEAKKKNTDEEQTNSLSRKCRLKKRERWNLKKMIEKKKNEKFSNTVSRMFLIVCCIGCFYQSFDIGMIYLGNNFYFWVLSIEPELIDLPRFTFCVARVIEEDKLAKSHPAIYQNIPKFLWEDHLTINEIFNLTLELDDILVLKESTFVSRANMSHVPITDFYRIEKFLTDRYTCFTTFSRELYFHSAPLEKYDYSEMSINIYFQMIFKRQRMDIYPSLYIFSHLEKSIKLEASSTYKITLKNYESRIKMSLVVYSLKETKVNMVSDNIESECFVYTRIGYETHEDAINDCLAVKLSKSKYKIWPPSVPIKYNQSIGIRFSNESHTKEYENALVICTRKFPKPSCEQRYLASFIEDIGQNEGNETAVILYPSQEDYNEIRQELKYSIVDLIIFIGGAINFWTGLAVITVFEMIYNSKGLKNKIEHYMRKKEIIFK